VLLAQYRLHEHSKTVAEGGLFDREFDQIAEIYEPKLKGEGRRWCAATRLLRQSFAASREGNRVSATKDLVRAIRIHPESLAARPFWGCLRQLLRGATTVDRSV
jgi:hypothetical protein